jgi:mannose-1-phosphate guanylyltransferase
MDVAGMVLCAGRGTRLRPLTELLPKPAVPLCGLPLVRFSLALLARAGVRRAVVNLHHLAGEMERAARASAAALGLDLALSREPVIAGTGGALREARPLLAGAGAVLVLNGDVLFDADLAAALAAHRASGAWATMVLAPMPPGARYPSVEADAALRVRRIGGRSGPGGPGLAPWHFTGAHVLSPEALAAVPEAPFALDVNHDVYPPLLDGRVRGHLDRGYWNDLGDPGGYLRAHLDLLAGRVLPARFPGADPFAGLPRLGAGGPWVAGDARVDPTAALAAPSLVLPGARIERGARVGPFAVVGRGARIGAGARVREAVVWDGAEVRPGEEVRGAVAAGTLRVAAA